MQCLWCDIPRGGSCCVILFSGLMERIMASKAFSDWEKLVAYRSCCLRIRSGVMKHAWGELRQHRLTFKPRLAVTQRRTKFAKLKTNRTGRGYGRGLGGTVLSAHFGVRRTHNGTNERRGKCWEYNCFLIPKGSLSLMCPVVCGA